MTKRLRIVVFCCMAAFALAAAGEKVPGSEPLRIRCQWQDPRDRSPLDLTFARNPMIVMLPESNLSVAADCPGGMGRITLLKDGQPYQTNETFVLAAPAKPGAYYMTFLLEYGAESREMEVCVFVPHKATGRTAGKGYDISVDGSVVGNYRLPRHSGNRKVRENPDSYQPPVWWLRVTERNAPFEIVPRLTVGELVVPSEDTGLPHTDLVPVCYAMWTTIEKLRLALEQRGVPGEALKPISMFRAPPYNRGVGSNAYGRHIYGDAFDFYIDLEGDEKASDLNRDGKLDRRDAYCVVAIIEELQADRVIPMGGIGVYNSVGGDHVVTMHLDMRGHRATWGYLYPAGGKRGEFSWASNRFADLDRRDEDIAKAAAEKDGKTYRRPRRESLPSGHASLRP